MHILNGKNGTDVQINIYRPAGAWRSCQERQRCRNERFGALKSETLNILKQYMI